MRRAASLAAVIAVVACGPEIPKQLESNFKMANDSMAFANFATGYDASAIDAELLQRMFGAEVCQPGSSPCELTPAARNFVERTNRSMGGGRCEGFAVLSSLFESGQINPNDFGAATARELVLPGNIKLQRELAYWFSTQLLPDATADKTKQYTAKTIMPALVEALKKGATERYRIGMVRKKGKVISGGHALTPFAYYADAKAAGVYWVRVYDNNNPDAERVIKVDTVNDRWEFEASENPARVSRLYFGDAKNKNPLFLAPVLTREGVQPCFFCKGDGTKQVSTSGGVQAAIEAAGGLIGVRDGELSGKVLPSFSSPLDDAPADFVMNVPANEPMNVILTPALDPDFPATLQSVEIAAGDYAVRASDLTVSGTDQLQVEGNGSLVKYQNESHTSMSLKSEVVVADGRTLAVTAVINGASSDVTASVDRMTGAVAVAAGNSAGAEVTMIVTATANDGAQTTAQLTFISEGDGGVTANAMAWSQGTGELSGMVTNNGQTNTVTNACTDGVKSGQETDVDCGSACGTKCSVAQGCATGADCQSTFCHAASKVCVGSSCEDGAKSGDETDVDCGGSCGTCAVGLACSINADCPSTASCIGNVCVASFVLGLTANGLSMTDSVVLQNNGGDDLTISGNGSFAFTTRVSGPYAVTILTQPASAICTVANGSGTATANVSNVEVNCTPTYALGGSVSGLPASASVTLQNGAESLTLSANEAFQFIGRVTSAYAVTITSQPVGASCWVADGAGTASADVLNVSILCSVGYLIGGTVSGLPWGEQVTLQNNGDESILVPFSGPFLFSTLSTTYSVSVSSQPLSVSCTVTNGFGTANADVMNVTVTCEQSGVYDVSFNSSGWLSFPHSAGSDFWVDGVLNPDDSMVLVGQTQSGVNSNWVISKVTSAGTLDPTFGTAGHTVVSAGSGVEYPRGVYRDSFGNYVVIGQLFGPTNPDLAIARLMPSGGLDPMFGTGGITLHNAGQWEYFEDVAQDALGRYVVVGRQSPTGTGPHDMIIARMNGDGSLDTTFGTGGWLIVDNGGDESGNSIVIDSATQDIIAVAATNNDTLVVRYTSSGTPVSGFGTAGRLILDMSGAGRSEFVYRALMDGNNILVAGRADGPTNSDLAVVKLTSTGALDSSFGIGGRLLIDRFGYEVAYAITPAPGSGWFIGGHSDNGMVIGKITTGGFVDTNYATNGFFEDVVSNSALAYHLMVDSQQRVVGVGTIRDTGTEDLGVVRLTR